MELSGEYREKPPNYRFWDGKFIRVTGLFLSNISIPTRNSLHALRFGRCYFPNWVSAMASAASLGVLALHPGTTLQLPECEGASATDSALSGGFRTSDFLQDAHFRKGLNKKLH